MNDSPTAFDGSRGWISVQATLSRCKQSAASASKCTSEHVRDGYAMAATDRQYSSGQLASAFLQGCVHADTGQVLRWSQMRLRESLMHARLVHPKGCACVIQSPAACGTRAAAVHRARNQWPREASIIA